MAIGAVTRADVASSVRTVTRKHSSNTAAAARRALSGFFSWAIADGLLGNNANPVDSVGAVVVGYALLIQRRVSACCWTPNLLLSGRHAAMTTSAVSYDS